MGCDGGTIPKRHELVKTKKKPEQLERSVTINAKWKYCALSNQPLKEPIVACELGRLYSKDIVIEYLLEKKGQVIEKMSHIKGLKDLHEISFHTNPAWQSKAQHGDAYIDDHRAQYICPVAGLEMNGRYKFCFLINCGCVISERALKQVHEEKCPICSKPYSKIKDVTVINPDTEDEKNNKANMEERRQNLKAEKKRRREEKRKFKQPLPVNDTNTTESKSIKTEPEYSGATKKSNDKLSSNRVKNLTVTGTVIGAKRKIEENSIFKSNAFKSIFTSHESAKRSKDQQSHWITYNPYH